MEHVSADLLWLLRAGVSVAIADDLDVVLVAMPSSMCFSNVTWLCSVCFLKQHGYNLEYVKELKNYNKQKVIYGENSSEAYVYIMGHCIKVMETCMTETREFESKIRNNPFRLLKAIK